MKDKIIKIHPQNGDDVMYAILLDKKLGKDISDGDIIDVHQNRFIINSPYCCFVPSAYY